MEAFVLDDIFVWKTVSNYLLWTDDPGTAVPIHMEIFWKNQSIPTLFLFLPKVVIEPWCNGFGTGKPNNGKYKDG